jgi:hypothetical protein
MYLLNFLDAVHVQQTYQTKNLYQGQTVLPLNTPVQVFCTLFVLIRPEMSDFVAGVSQVPNRRHLSPRACGYISMPSK